MVTPFHKTFFFLKKVSSDFVINNTEVQPHSNDVVNQCFYTGICHLIVKVYSEGILISPI